MEFVPPADGLLRVSINDNIWNASVNSPKQAGLRPTTARSTVSPPTTARGSPVKETVASSKLYRDISPTRVYAQTSQEAMACSLPELFKQRNGLESLRPSYSFDVNTKQDEGLAQPKLLQRLESMLDEKLSLIERLGGSADSFAAAQLRTDAYRQVFDAFLHSLTTYRGVLMRIKREYDISLDDAMASFFDNVHMKKTLSMTEQHMDIAVAEAKQKALEDAEALRREIQDEIEQQEALAADAEGRHAKAEQELESLHQETARLKQEAVNLQASIQQKRRAMLESSSFCTPALLQHLDSSSKRATDTSPGQPQGRQGTT